jgi:hypothetical protein
MADKRTGRGSDQFMLRMPDGMRDRIAAAARDNGRSMNAEIVSRLEESLEDDNTIGELLDRVERLESRMYDVEVECRIRTPPHED